MVWKEREHEERRGDMSYLTPCELRNLETHRPGTLLNNCSYDVWYQRYVDLAFKGGGADGEVSPLRQRRPGLVGPDSEPLADAVLGLPWCSAYHNGACDCPDRKVLRLFGCCEDVFCEGEPAAHEDEMADKCTGYRRLCSNCKVPICTQCIVGLERFRDVGSVPMALANDNYYGYALPFLFDVKATWLECAAASLCWTTMLVYYIEAPYGHLMLQSKDGPETRTEVRGNMFSFPMPWEMIEKQCWREMHEHTKVALPHGGEILAMLFQVQVVGGTTDVQKEVQHLQGATLRPAVVLRLIEDCAIG